MPAKKKIEPNHAEIPKRAYETMMAARQHISEWEEVRDAARAEIEEAMGDNEFGDIDGQTLVDWKTRKENRFDRAGFAKAHPEIEAEFISIEQRRYFTPRKV